ncbi:helix-turn-helix domain-containing protein [Aurantimicrobium minutum]|uniref:Helix-turn-helix domain-containing protein n=1 Tax=Aurantimicrobium minutum TaxID=708131 RepID=A0A173LYR1_9MICO|nr:helix-turn-helix domain-containing protein [Aurantimicrobium minutum]BAU99982.1 Uncharacterized protein AUMI_114400 [Aurantimicrobium minutum]
MKNTNFTMVPNAFIRSPHLDPYEKTIWIYLKSRQGVNATSWPSHQTISKETSIGKSTVKRKINNLIEKGLLQSTQRFVGHEQTTNTYTVLFMPDEFLDSSPRFIASPPEFTSSYKEDTSQEDTFNNTPFTTGEKSWTNLQPERKITEKQREYLRDLIAESEDCSTNEADEYIDELMPLSQVEANELISEYWVELRKNNVYG